MTTMCASAAATEDAAALSNIVIVILKTVKIEPTSVDAGPPDLPRLIQEALAELGCDADAIAIAERVRRLDIGLPVEGEFSVVCAWLGKCQLLHKLDQHQVPVVFKQDFQVPDLLAKFTT